MEEVEVVSIQEFGKDSGIEIPRVRDSNVFLQLRILLLEKGEKDFVGKDHARGLSSQFPGPPAARAWSAAECCRYPG